MHAEYSGTLPRSISGQPVATCAQQSSTSPEAMPGAEHKALTLLPFDVSGFYRARFQLLAQVGRGFARRGHPHAWPGDLDNGA